MFGFGTPSEIEKLPSILFPGEVLDCEHSYVKAVSYDNFFGVLALTDQRILFFSDGMLRRKSIDFPLVNIISINCASLFFGAGHVNVTILTKGESVNFKNVPKSDGEKFVQRARMVIQQLQAPQPQQYSPASNVGNDFIFCMKCGCQLPQDVSFCGKCGAKIPQL